MNDGQDDIENQRPSVIVATTVITLVLAASAVLWRNHSRDEYTRAESFKSHESGNRDVAENEGENVKPVRSKERRRRGKDPMKELMKGGKKAKELNKLINSISIHPTSPSSPAQQRSPSRGYEPSSDHDHRDASVSSFKSSSSRAEAEHEFELEETSPHSMLPNNSTPASQMNDAPQLHSGGHEDSPSFITSSPNTSDYLVSPTTSMDTHNELNYSLVKPKHSHSPRPPHSETSPSLSLSHSLPLSSTRGDMDRVQGPTNFTSLPVSTSNANSTPKHELPMEDTSAPSASTTAVSDPPSMSLKRGRKRNKSPASRNVNLGGDTKAHESSSTQGTIYNPNDIGLPQSPLSAQTQLASLRGALEAARLREEKTRYEVERLKWEAQLAKRRETEYQTYMNYLTHQLHSYASFVVAMQAPGRQLPTHEPPGAYSHQTHSLHNPSASIGSSSSTSSSSFATDKDLLPTDFELAHGPLTSASLPTGQSHPTPAPIATSLPSPPPSETVSSPTHPPLSAEHLHEQSQTYTNSYPVESTQSALPENSENPALHPSANISSSSTILLQAQLPSPSASISLNSPATSQMSFTSPPLGYDVTMTNGFADFGGFNPVGYYPSPFFQGSIYPPMPLAPAYPPTFFEQGNGRTKTHSKGKSNRKAKDKREKDRVSIKDEAGQPPHSTTFSNEESPQITTSRSPSPTAPTTQYDATLCKRDPSDCSSSSSSSLPSTPSSRSRSHHSPRNDQLPKTLVMSETLPSTTSQTFSPLEMLGLNMERVRDSSRGRVRNSFIYSAGSPSHTSYGVDINEGREDGDGSMPGSGYRIYGLPNAFYGSGSSNGDEGFPHDDAGGPLNDMLADAILKRPEAMRIGSMSRISEARPDCEQLDERAAETLEESAKESSAAEEEERKLPVDPILEFTFPSLSNWGSVQSAKTAQHAHEVWVEKAPSSPPLTPPAVMDDELSRTGSST
ncbi:hypothetical protein L218DRAFT_671881 [Marasmius fiardii PR-910]|nr:hypothetical protein L218DRAFT_671881 [Marasmius fiardii PR-910]